MQKVEGWAAYLDVYGFESEVKTRPPEQIEAFLADIFACLQINTSRVTASYQFSDCVFAIRQAEVNKRSCFVDLVRAIKSLQTTAFKHGQAFRGAVMYGTISFGANRCFGRPITEAARLEQGLAHPVVIVPEKEVRLAKLPMRLEFDEVPTKTGETSAHLIAPSITVFREIALYKRRQALVEGPANVAVAWRETLQLLAAHTNGGRDDN